MLQKAAQGELEGILEAIVPVGQERRLRLSPGHPKDTGGTRRRRYKLTRKPSQDWAGTRAETRADMVHLAQGL